MNNFTYFKINYLVFQKIILIILFITIINPSNATSAYAANSHFFSNNLAQIIKEKKVTINVQNKSLKEILVLIQQQSGVDFAFQDDGVDVVLKKLSLNVKDVTVEQALNNLLNNTGYGYKLVDNVITIIKDTTAIKEKTKKERISVTGKIMGEMNRPIIGATVIVVGTTVGAITNNDGVFGLSMFEGDEVEVSYTGYKSRTQAIYHSTKHFVLRLSVDVFNVDDIIVTGYQNVSRENFVGSAVVLKGDEILNAGETTIEGMLQGMATGVQVKLTSGMVGTTPKIKVRGTSTILGNGEPLWVVDGIVQHAPQGSYRTDGNNRFSNDAAALRDIASNSISWLNPQDINTITILKDASATAVYGSKAANGVIVITTKKAVAGQMNISYSTSLSIKERPSYSRYDQMNSKERMAFSREIYDERIMFYGDILPIGFEKIITDLHNKKITEEDFQSEYRRMEMINTDWFKELFRPAFSHNHNLSVYKGSDKMSVRASFAYSNQQGDAKGNDMANYNANISAMAKLHEKVILNVGVTGSVREVDAFAFGLDPFKYAYNTSRVIPMHDEDGKLYYHDKMGGASSAISGKNRYLYNIKNELENTTNNNQAKNFSFRADLSYQIVPWLKYEVQASMAYAMSDIVSIATERSNYIASIRGYNFQEVAPGSTEEKSTKLPYGGLRYTESSENRSITTRNSLLFSKTIDDAHIISAQIGFETSSTKMNGDYVQRYGYQKYRGESYTEIPITYWQNGNSSRPWDNDLIAESTKNTRIISNINNYISEYVIAAYNFKHRYIVNFNARLDASNRFGHDLSKRFQPTWSMGGRWSVAEEDFMANATWLGALNLSATYGFQGNAVEEVSPYLIASVGMFESSVGENQLTIKSLPYPNLGWEKTKSYNLSLELSLLGGRLNTTFEYYGKTSDVLGTRNIPIENGFEKSVVKGTKMKNKGWELVFNVVPIKTQNTTLQLSLNTSINKNSLYQESKNNLRDYLNGTAIVNGKPFSTLYSYQFNNIDAQGYPTFNGLDIDKTDDYTKFLIATGKIDPDFSGGLSVNLRHKNLTINAQFSTSFGGSARLPTMYNLSARVPTPEMNVSRELIGRWKKQGDEVNTIIPKVPGFDYSEYDVDVPVMMGIDSYSAYELYNQSDIRVAKSDFIRCRQLSVGYNFDSEKIRSIFLKRLSVTASVSNPFLITFDKKWNGLDPETGGWPVMRVFSLSLNVSF